MRQAQPAADLTTDNCRDEDTQTIAAYPAKTNHTLQHGFPGDG
jgi:hypothetical protein